MMILYKIHQGILVKAAEGYYLVNDHNWDDLVNRPDLYAAIRNLLTRSISNGEANDILENDLLPPIGNQEIWAAGVTYLRSKVARMEEAKGSGGGNFYDRVYDADRPELFFKSTAARVVGHQGKVRIRRDSSWNVPEPELTLLVNCVGKIAGYTIGNDMSSRDIEGENPLYLPQAKTYDRSAAIGPGVLVLNEPLPEDLQIGIEIVRKEEVVFQGEVSLAQMKRNREELVEYLFRECSFPTGCLLMTGTGIVPPDHFTLDHGDEIRISIEKIGTLINFVE
jgi:2-dehydro-3-deoxy-D-arabinonate dehydratase